MASIELRASIALFRTAQALAAIGDRLAKVFKTADENDVSTEVAARQLAATVHSG